jgi:anti-sigma regulatory factor (Ser/Thr protein kinase)
MVSTDRPHEDRPHEDRPHEDRPHEDRPHELVMTRDAVGRELGSVGQVRRAVRDFLTAEGVEAERDDVLLVVSELVTNSMMHAHHPPQVVVRHELAPERIDIEVSDDSPVLPARRPVDRGRFGGRGLWIVDRLSSSWGVRPGSHGKTTWATVSVPPLASCRRGQV